MRLVNAKLRAGATDDGLVEFEDNVPLGKVYVVDMDTIREGRMFNAEKRVEHKRMIINEHQTNQWLPLELLELPNE